MNEEFRAKITNLDILIIHLIHGTTSIWLNDIHLNMYLVYRVFKNNSWQLLCLLWLRGSHTGKHSSINTLARLISCRPNLGIETPSKYQRFVESLIRSPQQSGCTMREQLSYIAVEGKTGNLMCERDQYDLRSMTMDKACQSWTTHFAL